MEAALGLSYPTIRTRLSALKNKLQGAESAPGDLGEPNPEERIQSVLTELQEKKISFDEAMAKIKRLRGETEVTK